VFAVKSSQVIWGMLSLSVFLLTTNCNSVSSAENIEQVSSYDAVTLEGKTASGVDFTLRVELGAYAADEDGSKGGRPRKFWGADELPSQVIKAMELKLNKEPVSMPVAAIKDLGNVNVRTGVFLMEGNGYVSLYVRGGDGSVSYKASLRIEGRTVVSRRVEFMNAEGERDSKETIFSRR
jgi:hypothetical protein